MHNAESMCITSNEALALILFCCRWRRIVRIQSSRKNQIIAVNSTTKVFPVFIHKSEKTFVPQNVYILQWFNFCLNITILPRPAWKVPWLPITAKVFPFIGISIIIHTSPFWHSNRYGCSKQL